MPETLAEKIARLELLLASGVTEVKNGEISTKFDLAVVARQLQQARQQDAALKSRRPPLARIKLT